MQKITRIAALLLVAFALVLALVAFGLARNHARQAAASASTPVASPSVPIANQASGTPVVVAASDLTAGQVVAASSLQLVNKAQVPQASFGSIDAVAGRVLLVNVPAGAPITATLIAHSMATQLVPGERALAVPVDEVAGVANRIVPGDYVDVFLSLKNPSANGIGASRDLSQTRLLLSRLRVLAYGDQSLPVPVASNSGDASASKPATAEPARTAVLAVPMAEVDQLLLGAQNGKLTLALRYAGDNGLPDYQLFPQPPVVLSPFALSSEQRSPLAYAENDAFAGIDGSGLAGQMLAAPRVAYRRPMPMASGLEIIRGTQRSDGAQQPC
jgi:pilus assembly protein CpaB